MLRCLTQLGRDFAAGSMPRIAAGKSFQSALIRGTAEEACAEAARLGMDLTMGIARLRWGASTPEGWWDIGPVGLTPIDEIQPHILSDMLIRCPLTRSERMKIAHRLKADRARIGLSATLTEAEQRAVDAEEQILRMAGEQS